MNPEFDPRFDEKKDVLIEGNKFKNKILILGVSGDNPSLSRQLFSSGGLFIDISSNNKSYKLITNPGIGLFQSLMVLKVNPLDIDFILATDGNIRRSGELNSILAVNSFFGQDKKVHLISTEEVIKSMIFKENTDNWDKLTLIHPNKNIDMENFRLTLIPTYSKKLKEISDKLYGYKLITPEYRLCYTGDTSFSKKMFDYYKDCDIFITNIIDEDDGDLEGLTYEEIVNVVSEIKPKLCILLGFSYKLLKKGILNISRKISLDTNTTCVVGKDGMVLNPLDYGYRSSQKTLLGL